MQQLNLYLFILCSQSYLDANQYYMLIVFYCVRINLLKLKLKFEQLQIICNICDKNMFIKSYFSHHLHQCQWTHDTSMYFLYKKQILIKWNFNPILQIGSDNWILTIQLFGPNYSNSSNTIRKPENEWIWIPLFGPNYSNSQIVGIWNNSFQHWYTYFPGVPSYPI